MELSKTFKKISGVYWIKCHEHLYIGSSVDLYKRILRHKNDLKSNRHYNVFLQRLYNKYPSDFKTGVLEVCDNFVKREAYWIRSKKPDINVEQNPLSRRKTEVTKLKIAESLKGRFSGKLNPSAKMIHQYTMAGLYIKSYDTRNQAALTLGISKTSISNCIQGRCKSAGGYVWSYVKHESMGARKLLRKPRLFIKIISSHKGVTSEWSDVKQLANHLSVSVQAIYKAVKTNKSCKGYLIKFN